MDTLSSDNLNRVRPRSFLRRVPGPEGDASWSRTTYVVAAFSCVALGAAAWGLTLGLEDLLHLPNLLLIFVPMVLLVSVYFGFVMASITSALSILAVSFFTEPRYSFAVADVGYVWALFIFLAVSALTSSLAAQLRKRAESIIRRNQLIEQLYEFSSELSTHARVDELAAAGASRIAAILQSSTMVLIPKSGRLELAASTGGGAPSTDPLDREAAELSWKFCETAGHGTSHCEAASHTFYVLDSGKGPVGVLGINKELPSSSPESARLIDALRDQLALGLDRAALAEEKLKTETRAETEKLQTALLTSISHDLRTPLASILGNVSSLREYWQLYDDATRAEMLEFAEFETRRLSQFVENLLCMTRLDGGALRPIIELVDPSEVVGTAMKRVEERLSQHTVEIEVPADLPMVNMDFVLAEHVLVNLLDNAAKYSRAGSTIRIVISRDPCSLLINVMDEGPGIPENDLSRVFDRFFRADSTDHRRAGAGLGLAICRGFVEAMGGEIYARNRNDSPGADFLIKLPSSIGNSGNPL